METRTKVIGSTRRQLFDTPLLDGFGDAVDAWVGYIVDGHDSFVRCMRQVLNDYVELRIATTDITVLTSQIGSTALRSIDGILRCFYPNAKERMQDNLLVSGITYRICSALISKGTQEDESENVTSESDNNEAETVKSQKKKKGKPIADPDMKQLIATQKQFIVDPTRGIFHYCSSLSSTSKQEEANIDEMYARTANDIGRFFAGMVPKDHQKDVKSAIQTGNSSGLPSKIVSQVDAAIDAMGKILNWHDGSANDHIDSLKAKKDEFRQRLLVLRLWLKQQIDAYNAGRRTKKLFDYAVFPTPKGPLAPPISLNFEHQQSQSVFSNFGDLMHFYAANTNKRQKLKDAKKEKFDLSQQLASKVKEPKDQQKIPRFRNNQIGFIANFANELKIKLTETKPKEEEQLTYENKKAFGDIINIKPHEAIHLRGEMINGGQATAYRSQKSAFKIFRSWSVTGTRADVIVANGGVAEHCERSDNGIVDALEEVLIYSSRYEALANIDMPPYLYACTVLPFPMACVAISKLNDVQDQAYAAIRSDLDSRVEKLIFDLEKLPIALDLDNKHRCQKQDRRARIEWLMDGYEQLCGTGDISPDIDFADIQKKIRGTFHSYLINAY